MTIAPLLDEMHLMEEEIESLKVLLLHANDEADDKVRHLEAVGLDAISISRQLSAAQRRVEQLESELEHLLGDDGVLRRLRTRLENFSCPGCDIVFNVTEAIGFNIDLASNNVNFSQYVFRSLLGGAVRIVNTFSYDRSRSPQIEESLRSALAGFNAKSRSDENDSSLQKVYLPVSIRRWLLILIFCVWIRTTIKLARRFLTFNHNYIQSELGYSIWPRNRVKLREPSLTSKLVYVHRNQLVAFIPRCADVKLIWTAE